MISENWLGDCQSKYEVAVDGLRQGKTSLDSFREWLRGEYEVRRAKLLDELRIAASLPIPKGVEELKCLTEGANHYFIAIDRLFRYSGAEGDEMLEQGMTSFAQFIEAFRQAVRAGMAQSTGPVQLG